MNPNDYYQKAAQEPFMEVIGPTTGKVFPVREYTYGILVPDKSHPLSCVSVSNSSLSIDIWVGCSWQCRYCHVQGTGQDIPTGTMAKHLTRRNDYSIEEIINALELHPFFQKDVSILSIGTASTEPFAPQAIESTFEIMEYIVSKGWKNAIWIVTKGGFPEKYKTRLANITKAGTKVMISFCFANNPKDIEPVGNNRFNGVQHAKEAGATTTWYFRPLVPEWGATVESVKTLVAEVSQEYGEYIDMIVPGGLRWTEGIEYGLVEIAQISMPDIPKDDNVKDLPTEIWDAIYEECEKLMPGKPIYKKSSCALTYMLNAPSIILVESCATEECLASSCPSTQRLICQKRQINLANCAPDSINTALEALSIPAVFIGNNEGKLELLPELNSFPYTIRQTILKVIASTIN